MGPPEHKGEENNSQIGTHLLKTNLVRGGGILNGAGSLTNLSLHPLARSFAQNAQQFVEINDEWLSHALTHLQLASDYWLTQFEQNADVLHKEDDCANILHCVRQCAMERLHNLVLRFWLLSARLFDLCRWREFSDLGHFCSATAKFTPTPCELDSP